MKRKLILFAALALLALTVTLFVAGREGWGRTPWNNGGEMVFTSNGVVDVQPAQGTMKIVVDTPDTNASVNRSGIRAR